MIRGTVRSISRHHSPFPLPRESPVGWAMNIVGGRVTLRFSLSRRRIDSCSSFILGCARGSDFCAGFPSSSFFCFGSFRGLEVPPYHGQRSIAILPAREQCIAEEPRAMPVSGGEAFRPAMNRPHVPIRRDSYSRH
jgi:hypothetical protein